MLAPSPCPRALRGFTLLEMLFVLVVVGLLTGLIVPRISGSYQMRELIAQRHSIEDQLNQLPRRVRLTAYPLALPADLDLADLGDGRSALQLADGWQISFAPSLEISIMGTCSDSTVQLTNQFNVTVSQSYQIEGLHCALSALLP